MSLADKVWLTFFIIGVVSLAAICVDECWDAYKRSKAGKAEDWQ